MERELENSIDEQFIPPKAVNTGIRQHNPPPLKKRRFKNFVRSGSSGMMYDFFLSACYNISRRKKCNGSYVVIKLKESLPKLQNFKIFFDVWFCSLQLCLLLKSMAPLVTATVKADRLKECPLSLSFRKRVEAAWSWCTCLQNGCQFGADCY